MIQDNRYSVTHGNIHLGSNTERKLEGWITAKQQQGMSKKLVVKIVKTYWSMTSMRGRLSGSSSPSALASIFTSRMMATDTRRGACRHPHRSTNANPSAKRRTSVWSPRCSGWGEGEWQHGLWQEGVFYYFFLHFYFIFFCFFLFNFILFYLFHSLFYLIYQLACCPCTVWAVTKCYHLLNNINQPINQLNK